MVAGRFRRSRAGLALWVLGACVGKEPDPRDTDLNAADTDPVVQDTDPLDTDRGVDTDPSLDTDPDTDLPPDTSPPADTDAPLPPPPDWGLGFEVVPGDLVDWFPRVSQGDPSVPFSPEITAIAFGDLNEDGVVEVLAGSRPNAPNARPILRGYHLDPSTQRLREDAALATLFDGLDGPELVMGLMDLDGDGHLDALLGNTNRLVQWGRGDGRFDLGHTDLSLCNGALTGAGLWDVDADGWTDFLVGPGLCFERVHVLRRSKPRAWTDEPTWTTGQLGAVQTATVLSFPLQSQQAHLIVGIRQLAVAETGWLSGVGFGGSAPYLSSTMLSPDPVFWTSRPEWSQANILDVAAMGAAAEDLDGDGQLDVAMTVGASPIAVFGGQGDHLVDRTVQADLSFAADAHVNRPLPWSLALVDFDRDGRLDVFSTFGDDATSFVLAGGGWQRNRLWWNQARWSYVESGLDAGLDEVGGWMPLTLTDLDLDGDADLGLGGDGMQPSVVRNRVENGHHGVSLRLVGTASNHEALGAVIECVSASLGTQRRTVTALASPYVVAEPIQFVGLGDDTVIDTLRIRWPSGWTQELHGLTVDTQHTIVEPPPFVVDDPDRAAPADGTSRIALRVMPRRSDGTVIAQAQVSVRIDGPGTLTTATPSWSVDAFHVEVIAPSLPGQTRVHISVDGVEYPVAPRLTWE